MNIASRLLLILGLAGFGAGAAAQMLNDPGDAKERSATIALATSFLELVDQGRLPESWARTGPILRGMATQADWDSTLKAMRKASGPLKRRKLSAAAFTKSIDGAPDGHYFVVFFASQFANGTLEEKVILNRAGGKWTVEGYYLTPVAAAKP